KRTRPKNHPLLGANSRICGWRRARSVVVAVGKVRDCRAVPPVYRGDCSEDLGAGEAKWRCDTHSTPTVRDQLFWRLDGWRGTQHVFKDNLPVQFSWQTVVEVVVGGESGGGGWWRREELRVHRERCQLSCFCGVKASKTSQ